MSAVRTLVTGAPGWVGTSLVQALCGGFRAGPVAHESEPVRVLSAPGADTLSLSALEGVEVVEADLTEALPPTICEGVDTVFHCAGLIHPRRVRDLYRVNVEGTRRLIEVAVGAGVRRIVYLSSNSPAGLNLTRDAPMREGDPPRPYMGYGMSKLQAEWLLGDAHRRGLVETVVLRPCWFYGPNQPLRQTTFFRMIAKGRPPVVGDGLNLRSMSYVDNTVQALLLSRSVAAAAGEVFWIADRAPYRWIEILETVAALLDVPLRPLRLPNVAGRAARWMDAFLQLSDLYSQELHVAGELNADIAVSIDKARALLGYEPEIELEEGMRRSIAWCRSMGVDI